MHFYVIHLPHRVDRMKHFAVEYNREIGDKYGDSIVVVEAVDGRTHVLSDDQRHLFRRADFLNYPNVNLVAACMLSHMMALQHIVKHNVPYAVVFEDDVVLAPNFKAHLETILQELPSDAEFVTLSLLTFADGAHIVPWLLNSDYDTSTYISEQITPSVGRLIHKTNPSNLAFLVTLDGARKYLEHVYNTGVEAAADYNLHNYLRAKNIFYGSTKVLATGNERLPTSIQLRPTITQQQMDSLFN